jgi:hypothetical protein
MEPDRVNVLRKTLAQRMGFNVRSMSKSTTAPDGSVETVSDWTVRLPHWALLLITGAPPLLAAGVIPRALRRRRWRRGLCGVCGYDLRATGDRCPECGTPVPKACAGAAARPTSS